MEKYKSIIEKINFMAFLGLLASLPYTLPFIKFFWYAWIFTWLLEFRYISNKPTLQHRGLVYLSCGILVWLLWNSLSLLWADNTQAALNLLLRYASLLTIPFICVYGLNDNYDWRKSFKVLSITCITSIGVYMFTHYWVINHLYAFDKHSIHNIVDVDWWHMSELLLNIKHRMHYSSLLCMLFPCLAIVYPKIGKLPTIVIGIVLLLAIFMTGSRIAWIYLIVIAIITIGWIVLPGKKGWIKGLGIGVAVIVIVLGSVLGMLVHPRNGGLSIREMISVNENNPVSPAFEPRMAIWHVAIEHPQDYIAHGFGTGNATDYLINRYQQHGWEGYIDRHFSPHSQYLGVCMDLGIVALILFIIFWMGIPFFFTGTQRYWVLCATAISMCSMMTDMLLGGLEGIVFVVVMAVLGYLLPTTNFRDVRLSSPNSISAHKE